jgi:hypothetical protein
MAAKAQIQEPMADFAAKTLYLFDKFRIVASVKHNPIRPFPTGKSFG